jgi:hypothetical protein
MKHSDPATDFITRRDFMKKSALTVGAITLLSQGIGLASGTGGASSWWDMRCDAPAVFHDIVGDDLEYTLKGCDETIYHVDLLTTKLADEEGVGYHNCSFEHRFALWVFSAGTSAHVAGYTTFESQCNVNTGEITTVHCRLSSDPIEVGDSFSTSKNVTIGGLYDIKLTINVLRAAFGSIATTTITAEISWHELTPPNLLQSIRIPAQGSYQMQNHFVASQH